MIEDKDIFRNVLTELPVGLYFVDREQRIAFWNHGAEAITGYLSHQVLGHHMGENFLEHRDRENRPIEGNEMPLLIALRDGRVTEALVAMRHKDGHPVPVRLRTVPLRTESGRLLGAAEYFEPVEPTPWPSHRRNVLAIHGCTDPLTGVQKRGYTETQLHEHIETFREHGVPFGLALLQIDHLEQLRSRDGAGAVTAILRVLGETLEGSMREIDQLGRWGEAQFAVIVAECEAAEAAKVTERLRSTGAAADAEWWGDHVRITLSAGIAMVQAGDTPERLVERAESLLEHAIREGGNRLAVDHR